MNIIRKNLRRIISIASILVLLGACTARYLYMSQKYPTPKYVTYKNNQPVEYEQFTIQILDSYFMQPKEVSQVFEAETRLGLELKCVVADVEVKNVSNQKKQIELYPFMIETDAFANGTNMEAFKTINHGLASLSPTLNPGEYISLKIPFTLPKTSFKLDTWKKIEKYNFDLVLSLYPTKKIIKLALS